MKAILKHKVHIDYFIRHVVRAKNQFLFWVKPVLNDFQEAIPYSALSHRRVIIINNLKYSVGLQLTIAYEVSG